MSILFGLYIHITKLTPKRKLDFFKGVGVQFNIFVADFLPFLRGLFLGYLCSYITFVLITCIVFNIVHDAKGEDYITYLLYAYKQICTFDRTKKLCIILVQSLYN